MESILKQLEFVEMISISPVQLGIYITALLFLLIFSRLYFTWRKIKKLDDDASRAWININTLFNQRNNEIPKLINMAGSILKQDPAANEKLVTARRQVKFACDSRDIGKLGISEGMLKNALHHVFKLSEVDESLNKDKLFLQLKSRISGLENAIRDRREFYNRSVREGNEKMETYLGGIVANILKIEDKEELKLVKEDLSAQDLTTMFSS